METRKTTVRFARQKNFGMRANLIICAKFFCFFSDIVDARAHQNVSRVEEKRGGGWRQVETHITQIASFVARFGGALCIVGGAHVGGGGSGGGGRWRQRRSHTALLVAAIGAVIAVAVHKRRFLASDHGCGDATERRLLVIVRRLQRALGCHHGRRRRDELAFGRWPRAHCSTHVAGEHVIACESADKQNADNN